MTRHVRLEIAWAGPAKLLFDKLEAHFLSHSRNKRLAVELSVRNIEAPILSPTMSPSENHYGITACWGLQFEELVLQCTTALCAVDVQ